MTNAFGRFSLVLVAVTDPAIDREAMRAKIACADGEERSLFEVYTITRDEQYLRLKEGAKPLRFDLSPLRQRFVNRLVEDPTRRSPTNYGRSPLRPSWASTTRAGNSGSTKRPTS